MPAALSPFTEDASATLMVEELSPLPDAWEMCRRLASLSRLLFLDSAPGHPTLGRYSFLTGDPVEWIWSRGGGVYASGSAVPLASTDPFAVVAERLARFRVERRPDLPPFQGGAAGLFGYDLCHHLERLPRHRLDDFAVPD